MRLCVSRLKRLFLNFAIFSFIVSSAAAFAGDRTAVLPREFSGWQMKGPTKTSVDAATADPANAPVLKEYGFQDIQTATYVREDGRKLAIKAARFEDTSGAFGAYTFYYQPEMNREQIGDQGASFNERILFYRGNVLVDAVFDRITAMSAAELRELLEVSAQALAEDLREFADRQFTARAQHEKPKTRRLGDGPQRDE